MTPIRRLDQRRHRARPGARCARRRARAPSSVAAQHVGAEPVRERRRRGAELEVLQRWGRRGPGSTARAASATPISDQQHRRTRPPCGCAAGAATRRATGWCRAPATAAVVARHRRVRRSSGRGRAHASSTRGSSQRVRDVDEQVEHHEEARRRTARRPAPACSRG